MPVLHLRLTELEGTVNLSSDIPAQKLTLKLVRVLAADAAHLAPIMYFNADFLGTSSIHSNELDHSGLPIFHRTGVLANEYSCDLEMNTITKIPEKFHYSIAGVANPAHFESMDLVFNYDIHAIS